MVGVPYLSFLIRCPPVRIPWNILNIAFGAPAYTAFWLVGRLAASCNIFAFSLGAPVEMDAFIAHFANT
jgi:hypothetical protein